MAQVAELSAKQLGVDRVIALGFHVDYWNHLGWIDPFAQTMVQRAAAPAAAR